MDRYNGNIMKVFFTSEIVLRLYSQHVTLISAFLSNPVNMYVSAVAPLLYIKADYNWTKKKAHFPRLCPLQWT